MCFAGRSGVPAGGGEEATARSEVEAAENAAEGGQGSCGGGKMGGGVRGVGEGRGSEGCKQPWLDKQTDDGPENLPDDSDCLKIKSGSKLASEPLRNGQERRRRRQREKSQGKRFPMADLSD